ncbi:MAG: Asp-tRNA(Asn)/Glu-tRNA(Gln) amidotransferase GatCAB subunit B, partial [Atopobiaceae bacterium]|nr:Asp-tRNA(Asn)/Glu-tRNA(Gln) amidotransferase GatCAB subunit B [Atopobiaceae bacterium]
GGGLVLQETRHLEPSRRLTVVMRLKERNDDYRFFPDPDLMPFDLSDEFIERCRARVPELPDAKRDRYVKTWGLRRREAALLAAEPKTAAFFEDVMLVVGAELAQTVANVMVNLVPGFGDLGVGQVASVARLLAADAITFVQARDVLAAVDGTADDVEQVVDRLGMRQPADALASVVDEVLGRCQEQVRQYQAGNRKVVGFLVGQCMKASKGSGNPKLFNQLLQERLEER